MFTQGHPMTRTPEDLEAIAHTPGPWHAKQSPAGNWWITASYDNGWKDGRYMSASGPMEEGDALLIAAAPEMLEALKEVVRISDRKHDAWDKAHTAIARAEGRL